MSYVCDRCLETKNHGRLNKNTGKFICSDCLEKCKCKRITWDEV